MVIESRISPIRYHSEFNRVPEEPRKPVELAIHSERSADLPSTSSTTPSSVETVDTFPEEKFSSSSVSSNEPLPIAPETAPNTPRLRQLVARIMGNSRQDRILKDRENFRKSYNSFVQNIGKNTDLPPPAYYAKGMRLLGDKILASGSFVTKAELMRNPSSYFSKSDLDVLRQLQGYLLNPIPGQSPLHEYDWWALSRILCVTPNKENRDHLIQTAADFKEILSKGQPLHNLRLDLKEADQAQAHTSSHPYYSIPRDYGDVYYKSRWETACDLEIFAPINDSIERITNDQAYIAAQFRKWDMDYLRRKAPSLSNEHDTTDRLNNGDGKIPPKAPKKSIQLKYQKEYQYLSATRQTLEKIHDDLFQLASKVFGELAKSS